MENGSNASVVCGEWEWRYFEDTGSDASVVCGEWEWRYFEDIFAELKVNVGYRWYTGAESYYENTGYKLYVWSYYFSEQVYIYKKSK